MKWLKSWYRRNEHDIDSFLAMFFGWLFLLLIMHACDGFNAFR